MRLGSRSQVCNGGRNRCLVPICCKGNSCPEHRRWEYNFTLILTILAISGEVMLCLSSITRQDGEVEDTLMDISMMPVT